MAQDALTAHCIGGICVVCVGIWWLYRALKQYYLANLLQSRNYNSRYLNTNPCLCAPGWPVEGWLKILLSPIGMINELNWGDPYNNVITGKHVQHSMLCLFAGFTGVADLLTHYYPSMMPPDFDSISLSLAFFMSYWIFSYHKHGDMLEDSIHGFLLPLCLGGALATLVGVVWKNSVIPAFFRSVFVITLGTWLVNTGLILYPPSGIVAWDPNDVDDLMLLAGLFTLHFAFALFFSVLFLVFIYALIQRNVKDMPLSTVHIHGQIIDGKKLEDGYEKQCRIDNK